MDFNAMRRVNVSRAIGKCGDTPKLGPCVDVVFSTWDKIEWDGNVCYVNGFYTDDRCTAGMSHLLPYSIISNSLLI
jgi:hypothetical protein